MGDGDGGEKLWGKCTVCKHSCAMEPSREPSIERGFALRNGRQTEHTVLYVYISLPLDYTLFVS